MSEPCVVISSDSGGIWTLIINRPQALNALNKQVFDELDAFFSQNHQNRDIRGVIVTGAGDKAFVAGADIKEFQQLDEAAGSSLSKRGQEVFFSIERFHAPVLAAINGFALGGGCELAMACHLRIASEKARFGQPEVNLGLIPGYGATQRLPLLVGKSKAMELLLTGRLMGAEEALQCGLVNEVTTPENLLQRSTDVLSLIATKAPLAVEECIRILQASDTPSEKGYKDEYSTFGKLIITDDAREGAGAFTEKRNAIFTGK